MGKAIFARLRRMTFNSSAVHFQVDISLWYKKVYLPLYKVAYTPFYIQGDGLLFIHTSI